jgi:hypothetical protein
VKIASSLLGKDVSSSKDLLEGRHEREMVMGENVMLVVSVG